MPYYLDLQSMSLDDVETLLVKSDQIKIRMLLKEGIREKFSLLREHGIADAEHICKGHTGLHDIKLTVETASLLPSELHI